MARTKDNLKIDIDQSTADEVRTVTVTITAPAKDFLLPDLLAQRGAVEPYEGTLKQAIREATEGFLGGADELIAGIATAKQGEKREAPESAPKSNDANRKAKSKREKPSEERAMSSIPPIAPGDGQWINRPSVISEHAGPSSSKTAMRDPASSKLAMSAGI